MLGCLRGSGGASDSRSVECAGGDVQVLPVEAGIETQARENATALHPTQAHGFGDLPWHVLQVLMSHVVGHADADTVRAARLVCRSWHEALSVNITAAVLRPLTKQCLDIDSKNRPIVNHSLEGLRVPTRSEYVSLTEAILESSYAFYYPEPDTESVRPVNTVSVKEAEAAREEADKHWQQLKASAVFPKARLQASDLPRANSLGHFPCEASDASDAGDSSSTSSDDEDCLHTTEASDALLPAAHAQSPIPAAAATAGQLLSVPEPRAEKFPPDLDGQPPEPTGRTRPARRLWFPSRSRRHTGDTAAQSSAAPPASASAPGQPPSQHLPPADRVIVVGNRELDEYALQLRRQFRQQSSFGGAGDSDELPEVVLRVPGPVQPQTGTTPGGDAAAAAAPGPRPARIGSGVSDGRSPSAAGASPGSASGPRLAFMNFWGRSRSGQISGGGGVEIQVGGRGGDPPAEGRESEEQAGEEDTDSGDVCKSEASTSAGGGGAGSSAGAGDAPIPAVKAAPDEGDDCNRFPLPRCAMLQRPVVAPVTMRVRRDLIAPQHAPLRPAFVALSPLRPFANLQMLAIRQAAYGLDAAALAAMTGLTHLALRLQRRQRLGVTTRLPLALLPPPESLEGVWAAVAGLPRLRRLDLSHSHTVAPSHLALLAALPALEALDLTGVHLPLSALQPLKTLTAVTQLRIPNVKVVNESFMPLIGERRTVPALAGLLDAMPQLRHLDLFWQGAGDNQSIMKDPKHLRTLARATHLRRLDIAKIAQVTDRSLMLLAPLTAVTALKLGCNAWDLYRLTGRAFAMFRRWPALRVLHVEACRNLDRSALATVAASCPALECLHLDTSCRVDPETFKLVTTLPALSVLELVELVQVPDVAVRATCAQLPRLRPGMADHIIALKRCGGANLGKFGEKLPGGFLGRVMS